MRQSLLESAGDDGIESKVYKAELDSARGNPPICLAVKKSN
jgi:hypothetical protein